MTAPHFNALPLDLQLLDHWCLGKLARPKHAGQKPRKLPIQIDGVSLAKSNDPSTWASHSDAVLAYLAYHNEHAIEGVNFCFSPDDPFVCVDLDGCISTGGELHPIAQAIVERLKSYTEVSYSGRGLHVIVKAHVERNETFTVAGGGLAVELKARNAFTSLTGNRLDGTPRYIAEAGDALAKLIAEHSPPPPPPKPIQRGANAARALDDGHASYEKGAAACAAITPICWDQPYDMWLCLGMSLHSWDPVRGLELWIADSQRSSKFVAGECERKWNSFRASGITIGTLFHYADQDDPGWFQRDWDRTRFSRARDRAADLKHRLGLPV